MKIVIVIVNYGTPIHVLDGLQALVPELRKYNSTLKTAKKPAPAPAAVCWIVDNCSPDDSVFQIQSAINQNHYQDCVKLISHPYNGGFGAGNNVALRMARQLEEQPDYFYLLNPDAKVLPGVISKFIHYLDNNPHVGVVGGPLLTSEGKFECGAFCLPNLRGTIEEQMKIGFISKLWNDYRVSIIPPPAVPSSVGWVGGASMVVRRAALERAGLFDEGYFLYFEELDLCKRISDQGYEVHYLPEAGVIHLAGASTSLHQSDTRLPQYWHASRSRYLRKAFDDRGLFIYNIAAIVAGSFGRIYSFFRLKPMIKPHFVKDLIRYNYRKPEISVDDNRIPPSQPENMSNPLTLFVPRPHYTLKGNELYFMSSRNPLRVLTPLEVSAWEAVSKKIMLADLEDEHAPGVADIVQSFVNDGLCDAFEPNKNNMRKKVLIFEPHSDDAALSIGGIMWQYRDTCEFTLITLGSSSNYTSYYFSTRGPLKVQTVTDLRISENEIFMKYFHGKHIAAGENEAALRYRDGNWSREFLKENRTSISAFTNRFATEEERTRWTEVICKYLRTVPFDEIWMPMGVGTHTDHGITRDACLEALDREATLVAGADIYMYQEVPYDGQFSEHKLSIISTLESYGAQLEHHPIEISDSYAQKLRLLNIFASQFKLPAIRKGIETSARPPYSTGYYEHLWKLHKLPAHLDPECLFIDTPYVQSVRAGVQQWITKHKSTKKVRIIILMPSGQWKRHLGRLLETLPDARFEVYASQSCIAEIRTFSNERVDFTELPAGYASSAGLILKIMAAKATPTLFIAGDNRIKIAEAIGRLWIQHDTIVVRTMESLFLASAPDVSDLR